MTEAEKQKNEEFKRLRWAIAYQSEMSYEDFDDRLQAPAEEDKRSAEEIADWVGEMMDNMVL